MEQVNYAVQLREAYRLLVRRAALNELERVHHGSQMNAWQKILGGMKRGQLLTDSGATDEDREMAQQYCRFLGVTFATKFEADVASESLRLTRAVETLRMKVADHRAMDWLRSVAGRSWLSGGALFLPLAIFVVWSVAHMFKLSGFFPLAAASLAVSVFLLPMVLPVVLVVDGNRKKQLQMAGT